MGNISMRIELLKAGFFNAYEDPFDLYYLCFVILATDCKYYMSGNGGQVTMPITGSTYPASSTCIWTIEAPVGERIQVQVITKKRHDFSMHRCK